MVFLAFLGFSIKNPKYYLNLYHDRCLSHNFTFIIHYQQVTRCYNASVTEGVKVHMFPCYVSNIPSKISCGYHYFKLIIIPTEEINIKCNENIWRGWGGICSQDSWMRWRDETGQFLKHTSQNGFLFLSLSAIRVLGSLWADVLAVWESNL